MALIVIDVTSPSRAISLAKNAALQSSGALPTATKSYSPKVAWNDVSVPPRPSHSSFAAVMRLGESSMFAAPLAVSFINMT